MPLRYRPQEKVDALEGAVALHSRAMMAPDATHHSSRIGYVLKVFPRLSETFVINEIRELERQDVAVHVLSLHQPPAAVPHELLRELAAPILQVDAQARPSEGAVRHATAALAERIPEAHLL